MCLGLYVVMLVVINSDIYTFERDLSIRLKSVALKPPIMY